MWGGVGTNRIEFNQAKSRREMTCDPGRNVKEIFGEMNKKVLDAEKDARQIRW